MYTASIYLKENDYSLKRICLVCLANQTSASITGTSISGPITVANATVGLNAVIAIAMAI